MKQGDIYLVNFEPSIGREYKKKRPGLIVQSEIINSPYVSVVPITSNLQQFHQHDVRIEKDRKNKLFSDSVIKVQQISSFDKSRLLGKIGEVNSPVIRKVRGYLRKHFRL